ncbi:MAG: hypothetical protein KBB97_02550 [Bacilli bacterium]|nr:hypothetical protein [Bacilli bacterium]
MNSKIKLKLKRIWIIFLILFLTIPSFIIGKAFAYWAGLVNPPAAVNDAANATSGTGDTLPVSFNYTNIYTTTFKLVPTGCVAYAYNPAEVDDEVYNDYQMYWYVVDTTATTNKVTFTLEDAGLFDKTTGTEYTSYASNVNIKLMIGTYTTPGDETTFTAEYTYTTTASSLGNFNRMLNRNEPKVFRIAVSVTDGPRTNQTAYETFKEAFVSSNVKVELKYTVDNPSLYKTSNIWATFTTTGLSNVPLGPYYFQTANYIYDPDVKPYVPDGRYDEGDIVVVTDPDSPYYGQSFYIYKNNYKLDLSDPIPTAPPTNDYSSCTKDYTWYNPYDYGDFVIYDNKIYYWSSNYYNHNFTPNIVANAYPPTSYWEEFSTDTTENVWYRHFSYTFGDVVRWWTGSAGPTTPVTTVYISIIDANVIADYGKNHPSPTPGDKPAQWATVSQFVSRSTQYSSTTAYTAGKSVYVGTDYYIAVIDVQGLDPATTPYAWRKVEW